MKILHCVESYFPAIGGMQEVVKQLSERLVALGHQVHVATSKNAKRNFAEMNGVKVIDFEISGNMVNGVKGEKEAYEQLLLQNDYDVITFFAAQQWATDIALPLLNKIKAKKVSVPTGYSGLYWKDYAPYFENMKSWIHHYDMNVYLSNDYRDINFAREQGIAKTVIVPNGAGEDEFLGENGVVVRQFLGLKPDSMMILHVGSFSGWKGQKDAIEMFLRSDAKNATLLLIGNNYENFKKEFSRNFRLFGRRVKSFLKGNRIVIGYFDRTFTVAAYKQSNLFLFPSNIECSPIVLFECAAAKLPFLATDVGNSAEIASWTGGGKIIPTIKNNEGFSFAILEKGVTLLNEMIGSPELRERMGQKAFSVWRQKYSWEKITEQYESLYRKIIEQK
jgi:L-malate glycosyltransferase